MRPSRSHPKTRRLFLRALAASPVLALTPAWIERLIASAGRDVPAGSRALDAIRQELDVVASAKEALNVMDFEAVAQRNLPTAHFGYMATGTDDDGTIRANREGFTHYQIRVRRLIDFSKLDMSVSLFGATWPTPIVICPVGSQKAFHAEGEIATARAARSKRHLQILSTVSSSRIEDVNAARGEPVWWQLYAQPVWNNTRLMIKRAEASGCPAMVFTVDLIGGSNRETLERSERRDTRQCVMCHTPGKRKPMHDGLNLTPVPEAERSLFTWEYVKRLRDATSMKLLVKGIVTREDAELAVENGVNGIIVSNHGGRAEDSGRATIDSLPEVVAGVAGRIPVIVDGGFRRGTDIFKALALGATAVGVGRPYVWGLASFGQEGVEAVLEILRRELQMVMRQAGTAAIDKITKAHVIARA